MFDILNPISYGKRVQNVIDTFIDYWFTGVVELFGDDATPESKAPLPFYATGAGYWFSYNNVVSDTAPNNYGWSYCNVAWELRDANLKLTTSGIVDPNRPQSWKDAVMEYWGSEFIEHAPNTSYIETNSIIEYKYGFSSNSADPSTYYGINNQGQGFPFVITGTWKDFAGNTLSEFNKIAINSHTGVVAPSGDYTNGAVSNPVSNYQLQLPLADDSYWFFVGDTSGNTTIETNFYNDFSTHNTNNTYYQNTYNEFYNTYNVSVSPDLNFDIGVGPFGVAIGVGGIGGGGVVINPEVSFDDLLDILTPIVTDLNDNEAYGVDFDIELHDFDYYMSRYTDQGDFYITPIEQIPKLPQLPDLAETEIDIGSPLTIIGSSITSLFELYSGFGTSALLCFVFLLSVVVSRLRGD